MADEIKNSLDALMADKKAMDDKLRKQGEADAARFAAQQTAEAQLVATAKARWPDVKRDLDNLVAGLREREAEFHIRPDLTAMSALGPWVTPYKLNLKSSGRSVDLFFAMSRANKVSYKIEEKSMGIRNVSQPDNFIDGTTAELTEIIDSVSRSLLGLRTDDEYDPRRRR